MSLKKNKWTDENEVFLLKLISDNMSLEKIVKKTKRSEKEIIYKLKKITVKLFNKKKTKEEIFNQLKFLTMDQIEKIFDKQNKKNSDTTKLSELGVTNKNKITIDYHDNQKFNNEDIKKIYEILNNIDNKVNLLVQRNNDIKKPFLNDKNDTSQSNKTKTMNDKDVNKDNENNDNVNNNESSSFISSGNDKSDIIKLIQQKTTERNDRIQNHIKLRQAK